MAVRQPATELRSYGLRSFLLDQYDRVMNAEHGGSGLSDPFVLQVLHETMRLFPAVPFSSKISETGAITVLGK